MDKLGTYDVIVIGAGHAGIEAAHAAARLGARTAVFTLSLDFIGNMPCNPSIGGTAKGHLVREVDALGGLMGLAADATYLQSRMLNRGKGPAVHSLRVQTDRKRYHIWMKHALEQTANLDIHQGEIVGVAGVSGNGQSELLELLAGLRPLQSGEIRLAADGERAVLLFRDNGPGFPAEVLAHAFEPYFTTKSRGTGLGLAMVKKIVDEHGGDVRLSNREGGGAEVRIRLRLAEHNEA